MSKSSENLVAIQENQPQSIVVEGVAIQENQPSDADGTLRKEDSTFALAPKKGSNKLKVIWLSIGFAVLFAGFNTAQVI